MSEINVTAKSPSLVTDYSIIGCILVLFIAVLVYVTQSTPTTVATAQSIIRPIFALVVVTAVVWFAMLIFRNVAVLRGSASIKYFEGFSKDIPPEWIERPARTYKNLLELPVLFYLVCVLMLITGEMDEVQVALAWVFVYSRIAHAVVYIGINKVPYRFVAFVTGFIALSVIWVRFALSYL